MHTWYTLRLRIGSSRSHINTYRLFSVLLISSNKFLGQIAGTRAKTPLDDFVSNYTQRSRPVLAQNNRNCYYLFNDGPRGRFSGEHIIQLQRERETGWTKWKWWRRGYVHRDAHRTVHFTAAPRAPMTILMRAFITEAGARHRGSHVNAATEQWNKFGELWCGINGALPRWPDGHRLNRQHYSRFTVSPLRRPSAALPSFRADHHFCRPQQIYANSHRLLANTLENVGWNVYYLTPAGVSAPSVPMVLRRKIGKGVRKICGQLTGDLSWRLGIFFIFVVRNFERLWRGQKGGITGVIVIEWKFVLALQNIVFITVFYWVYHYRKTSMIWNFNFCSLSYCKGEWFYVQNRYI